MDCSFKLSFKLLYSTFFPWGIAGSIAYGITVGLSPAFAGPIQEQSPPSSCDQSCKEPVPIAVVGERSSAAIPLLRDLQKPVTQARFLQLSADSILASQAANTTQSELPESEDSEEEEEEIVVEGQQPQTPSSAPVYTINEDEIRKQGADSLAETLRGLPGFAVNDAGFGADTHTGTSYRGASINQSVLLLNGRPIGSNVNTYHGATDLNSIPTGAIEQVELSSGTATTLYGSEAVGGVISITTKRGEGPPKFNGFAQAGSYNRSNVQGQFSGSFDKLNYLLSYQRFVADNNYLVPLGAANRGPDGRLFNGDTRTDSYYGQVGVEFDARNSLSLDISNTASRRGLLYFGFPLQRDRLDHDQFNAGLTWKNQLGQGQDSLLKTTLSFNRDYFNTYGPTGTTFFRTGTLDSKAINARVDHDWQTSSNNRLRWGLDLQNSFLNGQVDSTLPGLIAQNGAVNRDRLNTALFALDTWKITPNLQAEIGLRQNFNSQFGSYLSPSLGSRWEVTPTLAVRGSWALIQRNPGLDQLYLFDTVHNWLSNPNLKPETGSSWTTGLDWQVTPTVTAQLTYFGSRLSDRLGIRDGRWENIGLVDTNGLEAAFRWKVTPQWSTFVNYTYTDAKIQTGPEQGLQLGQIPFSVGQLGVGYDSNGWQANLYASYFSGARRALFNLPGDSITSFSPAWLRLDLSLRVPITPGLGLTLFLENLTDQTYERANRIYQPGLTFRVGVQSL